MEKVAIITIATGKYSKLFHDFKCEIFNKFLCNKSRSIFLFTDDLDIDHDLKIYIPHLPWPLCTLLRFHHIIKNKKEFIDFDYVYYIDVDMIANNIIDEEVLPTNNEIICVKHYWCNKSVDQYENTNTKSTAYVNSDELFKYEYCQACFFGARTNSFLEMSDILNENINIDLKNNIIAKWHDESHLNKYILSHPHKSLHQGYAHPINFPNVNNEIKFIHKNANAWGFS